MDTSLELDSSNTVETGTSDTPPMSTAPPKSKTDEMANNGDDDVTKTLTSDAATLSSDDVLLEPLTNTGKPDGEETCFLCDEKFKQPRILSCLHVFCLPCLEKQQEAATTTATADSPDSLDLNAVATPPGGIVCKICEQMTMIPGHRGLIELPQDYVMIDQLDMSAIEDMQIVCTSCKAKEKAVARCSDCANFLCPNCVTAHQYMRCFENHTVVSFEDIQNGEGVPIHKPLYCSSHPTENLKFFCNTCQVPICNECMMDQHKPPIHFHERIADIEDKQISDLKQLISECKTKMELCEDVSGSLHNALMEQQMQRDSAKSLIQETFHSYKAMLEKKQEELLRELDERHSSQELHIMDTFHNVEKTLEKISDGCAFTERVLKRGNTVQILVLKKLIYVQLMSLVNKPLKPDITYNIEFTTDNVCFSGMVNKFFGYFKNPNKPTFNMPQHMMAGGDTRLLPPAPGVEFIPQMPPMPPNIMPGMRGISPVGSIVQTAGSEITSLSRSSQSPAMSDSGISLDASTSSGQVNPSGQFVNVSALSKFGTVGINNSGQVTLNGTIIPGLNMNNVVGLSAKLGGCRSSSTSPTESNMALNIGTMSSRSETPNLDTLVSMIQQPSPNSNLSNMTNIGHFQAPNDTEMGGMAGNMGEPVYPGMSRRSSSKMSAMQIRCKFGQLGPTKGQFNSPHGFCLGVDEDIVVADTNNHRVQIFQKNGDFKNQFGIPGREEGQLWYPRKVAVIRSTGKYVVCDRGAERSRMQLFTKNGHFVRKIAIRYIDIVAGLAITQEGNILAVDSVSPTVFCIAETGELLKWFDCSDYMREPSDIAISGKEYFVCDFKGHCVVVFSDGGEFLRRIGCENITNYPNGIDISDAGDVLVGDSHGNRFHVAVFQRDGSLIGEFECPYVKVSRCCGLKITSEGYVVTLAKNNHHVLVLNTLYIA